MKPKPQSKFKQLPFHMNGFNFRMNGTFVYSVYSDCTIPNPSSAQFGQSFTNFVNFSS